MKMIGNTKKAEHAGRYEHAVNEEIDEIKRIEKPNMNMKNMMTTL